MSQEETKLKFHALSEALHCFRAFAVKNNHCYCLLQLPIIKMTLLAPQKWMLFGEWGIPLFHITICLQKIPHLWTSLFQTWVLVCITTTTCGPIWVSSIFSNFIRHIKLLHWRVPKSHVRTRYFCMQGHVYNLSPDVSVLCRAFVPPTLQRTCGTEENQQKIRKCIVILNKKVQESTFIQTTARINSVLYIYKRYYLHLLRHCLPLTILIIRRISPWPNRFSLCLLDVRLSILLKHELSTRVWQPFHIVSQGYIIFIWTKHWDHHSSNGASKCSLKHLRTF